MAVTPQVPLDTYDSLMSTTLRNYMPKLEETIFTKRALLNWLKTHDRIKNKDGGAALTIPIIYGLNDTVASYRGYDTIATTPQDGITAAQYDWAQVAGSIAYSGIEESQNSGAEQIIDLFDAKRMQLEESLSEKLNYMFLKSGDSAGKDFLGLKALVADTDNAYDGSTTVGGIAVANTTTDTAGSTVNYWKSSVTAVGGALTIAALSTAYLAAARGTNDYPDLMMTTATQFTNYEALLQPQLRFSNSKQADAGFENLMYKGATVFFDNFVDSGYWYMVNSKYVALYTLKGKWMQPTQFVKPPNQDAKFAQVLCYGQFATSCRYRHALLTGLT